MVKPGEPWSKHTGSHGQTLVRARFAPNSGSHRSPAELGSYRWKSVVASLNSAIPTGFPRIPAPEPVLGEQGNRPATAPVRSAWIDPEPSSIRPDAPVSSARAMVVSGWNHGQSRVAGLSVRAVSSPVM